jgi:protein gp37
LLRGQIPLYLGTTKWVNGKPVFNNRLTALEPGHKDWVWPLIWPGASPPLLGVGKPSLIFVVDMGDLTHEQRPPEVVERVVETIALSPHIGQLLTKRADVMATFFTASRSDKTLRRWRQKLWLGFTAERQQEFDERWPHMRALAERGWTVFVSIAPMLTPVTLPSDFLAFGDRAWAVCSGEQESDGHWMDPAWARAVRDQCAAAGVPFFLLQMTGRKEIPHDLFVRQFPYAVCRRQTGHG